ncbi:MAG: hypothetical protein ACLP3K_11535 [Candidatus Acidiferrales bacterium]
MDEHNVSPAASLSQECLETLIADLRDLRGKMIAKERGRKSGVLAGQFRILAESYQNGRRPSRRSLKQFFYLITREPSA